MDAHYLQYSSHSILICFIIIQPFQQATIFIDTKTKTTSQLNTNYFFVPCPNYQVLVVINRSSSFPQLSPFIMYVLHFITGETPSLYIIPSHKSAKPKFKLIPLVIKPHDFPISYLPIHSKVKTTHSKATKLTYYLIFKTVIMQKHHTT